jgi:hypothetical protein
MDPVTVCIVISAKEYGRPKTQPIWKSSVTGNTQVKHFITRTIKMCDNGGTMAEEKKVYLIFKNFDMTEGRGPMILDRVMGNRFDAEQFAMRQPGVMGVNNRQHLCNQVTRRGIQIVDGDWIVEEVIVQ